MHKKINFGVLGAAYIATENVIPAMINSKYCNVIAIASRDLEKAKTTADSFKIPKYYGNYQELLDDEEIEAVYIPLPNHLHVPWTIKAMSAGKHVLIEKPIALSSGEAKFLLIQSQSHPEQKIMEAFMYKFHPQWIKVKELVQNKIIGDIKSIQSSFSFYDDNPNSIVNIKKYGGGCLMDVGCYPISLSRYLFNSDPISISAKMEFHKEFEVDILTSVIMEFESGHSSFFCSTILEENQKVEIFGTKGKIEMPRPFNPDTKSPVNILLHQNNEIVEIDFDICDQYTIQVDHFAQAILEDTNPKISLQESIGNMIIIEKIFESVKKNCTIII